MIDFILIAITLALVLHGFLAGILRTVLFIVSIVLAAMASAPLAKVLSAGMADATGWPLSVSFALARIAAGLLIFVSLFIAAYQANRLWGMDRYGGAKNWNWLLGALGGLVIGLTISYAVLALFFILNQSFRDRLPEALRGKIDDSWAVGMVGRVLPARAQSVADIISMLQTIQANPEIVKSLDEDPAIKKYLDIPSVKAAMDDPAVHELARARKWSELLRNPKVKEMADDPAVKAALTEAPVLSIIKRRIEEVEVAQLLRHLIVLETDVPPRARPKDKRIDEVMALDKVKAVLADKKLAEALVQQKWNEACKTPAFQAAMTEKPLMQNASDRELIKLIETAIEDARKAAPKPTPKPKPSARRPGTKKP